jgi:hypothetical protein
MSQLLPRPMSKSPKQVAEQALAVAERSLPPYSDKYSPRRFTQHQLFAIAALRQFFRVDYRGIEAILLDSSDLREVLGIREVPHFSTLFYAERRLFKGGVRLADGERGLDCEGEKTTRKE